VIIHRPADEWEQKVTIHKGQMLPVEVVEKMLPDQKLASPTNVRSSARHRRVQRIEQFVEIERV
jgi:hypothetical protein